jgi:hypothetical protein
MRIAFVLLAVSICGMAQSPAVKTNASKPKTDKPWTPPKTPWGDPDLQGSWTSDDVLGVPMERPKEFGERRYLTEQELAEREKRNEASQKRVLNPANTSSPARAQAEALASGAAPVAPSPRGVDVAPAPGNWLEFARRASNQTSQVIDPPDGRIPAMTPDAQKRLAAKNAIRRRHPETYEDWSLYDRCITRGVTGSIIPVIYGNGLDITQTPGFVAIRYEMVHEARIIPLDGRPHLNSNIRSYMGDPVGHWEGNTLVVETTNFNGRGTAVGANGDGGAPHSPDMKVVERFTRAADNVINYEATLNDPQTYAAPWTIAFSITHEPGYQIFEYACHEGNMAMHNMLSAARAEDAAAEAAKKK